MVIHPGLKPGLEPKVADSCLTVAGRAAGVMAAYLQVDQEDFVKVLLLHVEQEVVLGDARRVHTHRGRLEVPSLQRERTTFTVSGGGRGSRAERWLESTRLYTREQLLHALFRRHIHRRRHVTLSPEVPRQPPDGLRGRLVADVGDHHGGAL